MLFSIIVFALLLLINEAASQIDGLHHSQSNVPFNLAGMKRDQARNGIAKSIWHVKEIMEGMKNNQIDIYVEESISDVSDQVAASTTIEDISSIVLRNTTIKYSLLSKAGERFFSLDVHEHSMGIRAMTDDAIDHCHSHTSAAFPQSQPPKVGDVFAASVHGAGIHSNPLKNPSLARYMKTSHSVLRNQASSGEFLLLRRVIEVNIPATDHAPSAPPGVHSLKCFTYRTEDLHPLEILDDFTVDSELTHPFTVTYSNHPSHPDASVDGTLFSTLSMSTLYTSTVPCSDLLKWPLTSYGGYTYSQGTGVDSVLSGSYYYISGTTFACADYSVDIPGSFNMNYDYDTKKAVEPLPLAEGLVCTNCYAFMGAKFSVHVEYSLSSSFNFLTKVLGGAGVMVRVDATSPSISGSQEVELLPPTTRYSSIPITTGFFLYYKSGGVAATLSGSGSASGSAFIEGGISGQASLGMGYFYATGFEFPIERSFTLVPPAYGSAQDFTYNTFSLDLAVKGTINFQLSMMGLIGVNFDLDLIGNSYYASSSVASSQSFVRIEAPNPYFPPNSSVTVGDGQDAITPDAKPNSRTSSPSDGLSFAAGDSIGFLFTYVGYAPNERTLLTLSLADSDESLPILTVWFNTSNTGDGDHHVDWVVPESLIYPTSSEGEIWYVVAAASNMPSRKIVSEESFVLTPGAGSLNTTSNDRIVIMNLQRDVNPVRRSRHKSALSTCGGATPATLGFKSGMASGISSANVFTFTFPWSTDYPEVSLLEDETCAAGIITGPTQRPTRSPTSAPVASPTFPPTRSPTRTPTAAPVLDPTMTPSAAPTLTPTVNPSGAPTYTLTAAPSAPTCLPTASPTAPTCDPTTTPTANPTFTPTAPTRAPTAAPTTFPTFAPTAVPTTRPPIASFKVKQSLEGFDFTVYNADPTTFNGVLQSAIAETMEGVTAADVYDLSVTSGAATAGTKRLRATLGADTAQVSYSIIATNSVLTFVALSAQLRAAVESGEFTSILQGLATAAGVSGLASVTSGSVESVDTTPSPGGDSSSSSKDSSAVGMIVGIVVGGVALLVIVGLAAFYFTRNRKNPSAVAPIG